SAVRARVSASAAALTFDRPRSQLGPRRGVTRSELGMTDESPDRGEQSIPLPAEEELLSRPDRGFIATPSPRHVSQSATALAELAGALSTPGGHPVRLVHVNHQGLASPRLYGFSLEQPTDELW